MRDGDGVLMFDAGARTMANAVAAAAAQLGGLTRIVLGHGHTDHRGTAPSFDVPVLCHPDEVVDAEGSGGWRYWDESLSFLSFPHRPVHKLFHARFWDGGPVKIADTVERGRRRRGLRGRAHPRPRAGADRAVARVRPRRADDATSSTSIDMWGRDCDPNLPFDGYNFDTEQARESLRKLAALDPLVCLPGHAKPLTGDVRAQLERAAAA